MVLTLPKNGMPCHIMYFKMEDARESPGAISSFAGIHSSYQDSPTESSRSEASMAFHPGFHIFVGEVHGISRVPSAFKMRFGCVSEFPTRHSKCSLHFQEHSMYAIKRHYMEVRRCSLALEESKVAHRLSRHFTEIFRILGVKKKNSLISYRILGFR